MKGRNQLKLSRESMIEIMEKHFAGTIFDQKITDVNHDYLGFTVEFGEKEEDKDNESA